MADSGLAGCRASWRLLWVLPLLALLLSDLAGCAEPDSTARISPDARVIALTQGRWTLTTFGQVKQEEEFWRDRKLYRATGPGKAEFVLDANARALYEADRGFDSNSRKPKASDVVQVLDESCECLSHAVLSTLPPGARIGFQGAAYVKEASGPSSTGAHFSEASLQAIEITRGALQHITDRHTVGGAKTAGKSVFSAGEDIVALISDAQLLTPVAQSRGNCKRIFDAGRTIGTDRATGRQTSTYTVITTQSGKLVTAFPGLP